MTGVDWPGKSTRQSGFFGSTLSGRPVSRDMPVWSGPRQLSQPVTGAAVAPSARNDCKRARWTTLDFESMAVQFGRRGAHCVASTLLGRRNSARRSFCLQKNNTYTYDLDISARNMAKGKKNIP